MFNKKNNSSVDSAILDLLLESRHQILVVLSADKKIIKVNNAFKEFILRQSGKEISEGDDFLHYLSNNKASFYSELIDKAVKTGNQLVFETQFDSTSDDEYFQVVLDPVKSNNGEVEHIIIFSYDISDLRNAKKRLYEERERLSVTLKSIGDGVIVTDLENKIVYYNDAASEITGYDDTEVISKYCNEILKTNDALANNIPTTTQIKRKDNSIINIEYNKNSIKNNSGYEIGTIFVFKDITDRLKIEEEIIKNSKLDSLSLLAGGLAHDYNNLLTAILGNITLCKIFTEDTNLLENLDQAEQAALKASELTQKLITFSKGGEPVKSIFNLKVFLEESIHFCLLGSNVKVEFDICETVGDFSGDKNQLGQAINNIVINSKQSMPEGGTIFVSAKRKDEISEHSIIIEISDEGQGINEKILSRIFDPYFTTKTNSLGLGLSAAYSIIKRHNGTIYASNGPDKGATISISLPFTGSPQTAKPVESSNKKNKTLLHILIMDDEKIIRDALSGMLKKLGCQVTATENGVETIEKYKEMMNSENPFDLVMLDLTIPGGMGGKQTIANLLEIDSKVKAIVTSGYYDDPVIALYDRYGFSDVLKKPYTFEELSRLIQKYRY